MKVKRILILGMLAALCVNVQAQRETGTTQRADGSLITWHLSVPESTLPYSLVVLCEGSYEGANKTKSVLRLHEIFEPLLVPKGFALLTIEKWGVTPEGVDEKAFHEHNTRSQRIADHMRVLDAMCVEKSVGYEGTFIFIGGSEGGDVMLDLMMNYATQTRAGINFVGAGSHGARDEIWVCIQQMRTEGSLIEKLYMWWEGMPKTRVAYEQQIAKMIEQPSPDLWWFGQTYKYWADAFTREVNLERLYASNTPLLVVTGTKDSGIASCDAFVAQAKEQGMPVMYWRIDDMGHQVKKERPELLGQAIDWLCTVISE